MDSILDAPLLAALLKRAPQVEDGWHMPGHLAGIGFSRSFQQHFALLDTTELASTDDINHPTGPALAAMNKAAGAFGAGHTRFITTGSTGALQILLAAAVGRGKQLLIPRWTHQAVMHAAAVQQISIRFIKSSPEAVKSAEPYLFPQLTPHDIKNALQENPGCRAVLLTSPDYYGCCYNLGEIAEICHQAGALLLVDEAHGAHLAFSDQTKPYTAMAAGADACVQSGHKTLPVLTQGAYLHLSEAALMTGRLNAALVDRLIPMFQTSSPSFLIAASLDYARALMAAKGSSLIDRQLTWLARCLDTLVPYYCSASDLWQEKHLPKYIKKGQSDFANATALITDPLRLVFVSAQPDSRVNGLYLQQKLQQTGIEIELADLTRLVLIPSLFQNQSGWQKLADRLITLAKSTTPIMDQVEQGAIREVEENWRQALVRLPEVALPPDQAIFGHFPVRSIKLCDAESQISAYAVTPYPPGIPLIWPGEIIEKRHLDLIEQLIENGINISGIRNKNIDVLNV